MEKIPELPRTTIPKHNPECEGCLERAMEQGVLHDVTQRLINVAAEQQRLVKQLLQMVLDQSTEIDGIQAEVQKVQGVLASIEAEARQKQANRRAIRLMLKWAIAIITFLAPVVGWIMEHKDKIKGGG